MLPDNTEFAWTEGTPVLRPFYIEQAGIRWFGSSGSIPLRTYTVRDALGVVVLVTHVPSHDSITEEQRQMLIMLCEARYPEDG